MRNLIIGIIFGIVTGTVIGATVIGPRLDEQIPGFSKRPALDSLAPQSSPKTHKKETPETATVRLKPVNDHIQNTLIHWRMASAYSSTLPLLGDLAKRVEHDVWRVSDGLFKVQFHEPGTLVAPEQLFDAVRSGTIDAAFTSPADWSHKAPALSLFSSVPFGPTTQEYIAWFYFSGGQKYYQDIYHKLGIHSLICGMTSPEASGWFKKQIQTTDDLKGLRMRITGLGAKVVRKLGVETEVLSDGDVLIALESGALDAAEFSQPATDLKLGLHRMASNYYFPGWHQPATLFELMINLETWNALPSAQKSQLISVCGDNVRHSLAQSEAMQFEALKQLVEAGVQLQAWPTEILDNLRDAWAVVVREETIADRDFRRVWQSLVKFREEFSIWRELSHP